MIDSGLVPAIARAIQQHYNGAPVRTRDDGASVPTDGEPFEITLPNRRVTLRVSENVLISLSREFWHETGQRKLRDDAAIVNALISAMEFDLVIEEIDAAPNNGQASWIEHRNTRTGPAAE